MNLPLLYYFYANESPVIEPMTTVLETGNSGYDASRTSWNFSVCRPLFGICTAWLSFIVDSHSYFRLFTVLFLFFQVCCDAISGFDVSRTIATLVAKCGNEGGVESCLRGHADQFWGKSELGLLLRRDILCSGVEVFLLLVVCFIGVNLGFTYNLYSQMELHPKHSGTSRLRVELKKLFGNNLEISKESSFSHPL